jgi:hypothetical protein
MSGYSGTPLVKKLGVVTDSVIYWSALKLVVRKELRGPKA